MKSILLILIAILPLSLRAEVPPCFPGPLESNVERMYPYLVADDRQNCAAVWFCDVGHRWARYMIYGHGDNVDNCAYPTVKAIAAMFMTHPQKVAEWNDRFITNAETDPVKLAAYIAQDSPAFALGNAVPYPTTIPPSGLVTQDVKAYKLNASTNKAAMSLVGSVALGVPCDSTQQINGLYRVDRSKVKFPAGAVLPLTTWAKCTQ